MCIRDSLRKDAFSIASGNNVIKNVFISRTRLPIPDLSGKSVLERFHAINMTNVNQSLGFFTSGNTYKFDNCNALIELRLRLTSMGGAFPKFTNSSLKTLEMRNTRLVGGEHNGSTQYVLPELTFQNTPELVTFQITSDRFLKDVQNLKKLKNNQLTKLNIEVSRRYLKSNNKKGIF